jgi:hypothetical protein
MAALTDDRSIDAIRIAAGRNSQGGPVLEEIPAVETAPGRYVLASSPGLAQGAAAGDTIALHDDGTFDVVERGGNLAVQLLARHFDERAVAELVADVEGLGGRLDGGHDRLRVFTVPVAAGFGRVEDVFNAYATRHPGAEWYFANVYDERDGVTPLNWW